MVAKASALLGRPFMPWQQDAVDVMLETLDGPGSRWAYPTSVTTVQRQAGKTTMVQGVLGHRGGMLDDGRLFLTAQNRDKARARWLDMSGALVKRLPRSFSRNIGVSHEVLRWLRTGSELRPFAPNEDSMHSESPDLVAPDEIWKFTLAEASALQQAYLPGMITKNAQELITSTQGTDESEWLNELTAEGRADVEAGRSSGACYLEHSVPRWVNPVTLERADEADGWPVEQLDDERLLDLICWHHPAHGQTITRDALAGHLARFKRDRVGFIRGYGNLRLGSSRARLISAETVSGTRTDRALPDRFGVGVAVDQDGRNMRIVAAGRLPHGPAVVELVTAGDGWDVPTADGTLISPAEYVQRIIRAGGCVGVGISTQGAGRDLLDQLDKLKVKSVQPIGPSDQAAAVARFRTGLTSRDVLHRDQQPLTDAMSWAGTKKLAGGLGWHAVHPDHPVTALDAATLALWTADHPVAVVGRFRVR